MSVKLGKFFFGGMKVLPQLLTEEVNYLSGDSIVFDHYRKMTDKVLKGCKKYIIERVINPGLYWMTEYEREECWRKEREDFEYLLARDVEKYTGTEKIPIGEMIAINDERGFHRGRIMDIYNRNSYTEYRVSLVDCGGIDINSREIYFIKNKELKNKNLSIVQVSVHGARPAEMEIEIQNNFSGGIFHKRVCDSWSASAFQFVRDLILKNRYVHVKPVYNDKSIIYGEIYFIQEPDGVPVSLGQTLCARGFAVLCDVEPKITNPGGAKGDNDIEIEEKIPGAALFREIQNSKVEKKFIIKNVKKGGNKRRDLLDRSISPQQLRQDCGKQSEPFTSSSTCGISENENCKSLHHMLLNSSSNCGSSSIMNERRHNNLMRSSFCESFKRGDIYESKQTGCNSSEYTTASIFKVIQRSMKFFEKDKQLGRFSHRTEKNS